MQNKPPVKPLYHSVFSLNYHLVVVTQYLRRCITAPMLEQLRTICTEMTEKWGCELLEFNGEADHIHLLLSLNPNVAPSVFANSLKTVSSRLVRRDFARELAEVYWAKPVFWSRSYCILTCGGAPLAEIRQYIEQQGAPLRAHHQPSSRPV